MPQDPNQLNRLRVDSGAIPVLLKPLPKVPDEVKKRFPAMVKWEADLERWRVETNVALGGTPGG